MTKETTKSSESSNLQRFGTTLQAVPKTESIDKEEHKLIVPEAVEAALKTVVGGNGGRRGSIFKQQTVSPKFLP